ncbi:MAG: DUF2851 family protein [Flavobacteriaceae bacterium]|nr:MAG: DUF2851 family protein [Flavobacteriaceae bacterium]
MKEDFLHYIWRYALYSKTALVTAQKEEIKVVKPGLYNTNAGPDFLNSELIIDGQKWVGNIEIHSNTSDWYSHGHESDVSYDAVILHVVWNHDAEVYMKCNTPIPTLELKEIVPHHILFNYKKLHNSDLKWIPCEHEITGVDSFMIKYWLERLYVERLESKMIVVEKLLEKSQYNWEAVFFQLVAKNFGLSVNGDAFLKLAQSFDYTILQKEHFNELALSALLFGQAGFLEDILEDAYHTRLRKEYIYLKHKHGLKHLQKNEFQFFRMRPHNFPTIRIAQLVALLHSKTRFFSMTINAVEVAEFYKLFKIEIHDYWKTHFNFGKASKKSAKRLSDSFIDLVLINTVLLLKFSYQKKRGNLDTVAIIKLIEELTPEKNSIVHKFSELGISPKNALESQALLQLKNSYCTAKRCLECAIGKSILGRK